MSMTNRARNILLGCASAAMLLGSVLSVNADEQKLETAIFAGGCFWCVESDFEMVPGVIDAVSGYTGGHLENPTYGDVVQETTGHLESVKITFDANKISYKQMLHLFWRSVDPTDGGGQFCDRGESYTTAVFTVDDEQKKVAEASKAELEKSKLLRDPVVTPIRAAAKFYTAEDYHQDYYSKNPVRYKLYRYGCGRDSRVKELWGDDAWGGQGHS